MTPDPALIKPRSEFRSEHSANVCLLGTWQHAEARRAAVKAAARRKRPVPHRRPILSLFSSMFGVKS